jgi:hypothetical protein
MKILKLAAAIPALALVAGLGLAACGGQSAPAVKGAPVVSRSATAAPTTAAPAPVKTTPAPAKAAPVTYVPAQSGVLPDHSRTPGADNPAVTQATITSTICVTGWTATVRPSVSYTDALKQTQLANGYAYQGDTNMADYEEDHLIPLELGGSPTSALNLWPEPYAGSDGARAKDKVENSLRRDVCDGAVTLAAARQEIAANWVSQASSSAPAPAQSSAPVQPAAPAAPAPVSNYRAGEFCPKADHGITIDGLILQSRFSGAWPCCRSA